METKALLYDLNTAYGLDLPEDHRKKPAVSGDLTVDELTDLLADRINDMINKDFNALVQLLYRIDVSESKLRQLLHENTTTDADRTIARLVLERQWQKIITRRKYSQRDPMQGGTGDAEDRW
jgi:hypothetical protein